MSNPFEYVDYWDSSIPDIPEINTNSIYNENLTRTLSNDNALLELILRKSKLVKVINWIQM